MTLPPIGAIGSVLSQSVAGLGPGETSGVTGAGGLRRPQSEHAGGRRRTERRQRREHGRGRDRRGLRNRGRRGLQGIEGTGGGESGGFGAALTQAISSLDQSQQSAASAAQALATGTASNPESAVVTVEDAQLAMQLASQIRTKAVEAAQQIFQTQV